MPSEIKGTGAGIIAALSLANLASDIARLSKIIPLREEVKYVKKSLLINGPVKSLNGLRNVRHIS